MSNEEAIKILTPMAMMMVGTDNLPISDGYYAIQKGIKALQEQIVWHPYPKEKPTEHEEYLVTVYLPIWHKRIVCVDNYGWHKWTNNENDVVAWAEFPKPYEEGAEE